MFKKVAFTMFPAADPQRARAFYGGTLGLKMGLHSSDGVWTEYDLPGGGCLALFGTKEVKPSHTAGGSIALEVDDLDALCAQLKEKRVRVHAGDHPRPQLPDGDDPRFGGERDHPPRAQEATRDGRVADILAVMRPRDTSVGGHRAQLDAYRRMGAGRRVQLAAGLSADVRRLSRAGIR